MALTNEQKRQQSGRDMEFSRQQSGRNMERNRQQSGRAMEESRRAAGRKMRDDMRALAENNRLERTLPELPVRGKQPAKRGSAIWQGGAPSSGGGGGLPDELNESVGTRLKYPKSVIIPDGGYFAYLVSPIRQIEFMDAGKSIKINLQAPDYSLVNPANN